jgi:serine/threonine protein kinase/tetratricopeptide (TPR) repeat protein
MSQSPMIAGRYQLQEKLGVGGMGTVYKGTDAQTGETIAIKWLKSEAIAADPGMIERFQREGEALRQLNHPNIVKMLAAVEEDNKHYLIMEYVPGGDLKDLLEETPQLPIHQILTLSIELADALTRAHYLKIIHRDLKPANILIASDGTSRLTDFGVAHIGTKERITGTGVTIGTLDYLAPEIIGGAMPDTYTDIWAAGVMLFEMIAGQRPFAGNNVSRVIMSIMNNPVPDLEALRPDCPVGLVDLTYRMLQKDPNARIPSVRLVGAELEALIQNTDNDASPMIEIRVLARTSANQIATFTPTASIIKHNLPKQPTPFVGRETELRELVRLIDAPETQLVTVVGPGGMGKTRLALEMAERTLVGTHPILSLQNVSFPNGVYLIPLAPVSSEDGVIPTFANATGYQFQQGGREAKQQLLDNFEHLMGGVQLINEILRSAPGIRIIATSREKLNLSGETVFYLGGMEVPDGESSQDAAYSLDSAEYSAVKLFVQGAQRLQPSFELAGDDLAHVVHICRLVQGMPLGILLAASWVEMLTPKEIAAEVTYSLDFLETELRDIPDRHRSIRAVFDYSWNLMRETERETFMKLAVFRGGFTREAAQEVAGAGLRTLQRLVNKSLLRRDTDSGHYVVHELLRQYAQEQLEASGSAAAPYQAHMAYYANLMAQAEVRIKGPRQLEALDQIASNFENIRAAWEWAVEQRDLDALNRSLDALYWFCSMRGRVPDGEALFQKARLRLISPFDPGAHPVQRRLQLRFDASGDTYRSQIEQMLALARKHGTQREIAFFLWTLGVNAYVSRDFNRAIEVLTEGLKLFQMLGDDFYVVELWNLLGICSSFLGQVKDAEEFDRKARDRSRETGNKFALGRSLGRQGLAAVFEGNDAQAKSDLQEALVIRRDMGDRAGVAMCLSSFSWMAFFQGDFSRAKNLAEKSLELASDINNANSRTTALNVLGLLADVEENYVKARQLCGESLALVPDPTVGFGAHLGFALAACGLNEDAVARQHVQTLLESHSPFHTSRGLLSCLTVLAVLYAHQYEAEQAVKVLALVFTHPGSPIAWIEKWPLLSRLRANLEAELGAEKYGAAWERGMKLELETVLDEWFGE